MDVLLSEKLIKTLTEEEFRAGYRKAQLIDIREADEYNAGHILGARNIPLSQIRLRHKELRQDQTCLLILPKRIPYRSCGAILKNKATKISTNYKVDLNLGQAKLKEIITYKN